MLIKKLEKNRLWKDLLLVTWPRPKVNIYKHEHSTLIFLLRMFVCSYVFELKPTSSIQYKTLSISNSCWHGNNNSCCAMGIAEYSPHHFRNSILPSVVEYQYQSPNCSRTTPQSFTNLHEWTKCIPLWVWNIIPLPADNTKERTSISIVFPVSAAYLNWATLIIR